MRGSGNPVLRWVLLVGNAHPGDPGGREIPIWSTYDLDYRYTLLDPVGNDSLPDIGIARITPRDPTDLDSIVEKILRYEKSPPTASCINHFTYVANGLGGANNMFSSLVRSLDTGNLYGYWSPLRMQPIQSWATRVLTRP